MKKIALVGLKYDTNLGDPIIYESTKFLVEKALKEKGINEYEIIPLDMTGRIGFNSYANYPTNKIVSYGKKILGNTLKISLKLTKKIKRFNHNLQIKKWYLSNEYNRNLYFYNKQLKNVDMIIFVGGGIIKYKYQSFNFYIESIIKIAEKNNIPVIFNSVGVEGYDENDSRCALLKKALNKNCVKLITTRDDLKTLEMSYLENKKIITAQVSDPATWIGDAFNVKKDDNSGVFGLGVIRDKIFRDNDIDISEEQLLSLWRDIIDTLDKRNEKWVIFTNGLSYDYEFGIKLMKYLGRENEIEDKVLDIPKTPEELVKNISKFKGIIASRLHACIIAYSLEIPAVALVWNNKLSMFGKSINASERFITNENFNARHIVDTLEEAVRSGYDLEEKLRYKNTSIEYLRKGIELF